MPSMTVPKNPKIVHIIHVDRLSSIIKEGCLWCDAEAAKRSLAGTTIGCARTRFVRRERVSLDSGGRKRALARYSW